MVYRRRLTRRRYNRRGGRTLSSYHIATRTSARAQARQIYSLNRRITAIQRRTKPEIRVSQPSAQLYAPTGTSTDGYGWGSIYYISPNAMQGTGGISTDGYMCRLLSGTVYFNANYSSMTTTVQPITYRVTIIQTKAGLSQNQIQFQDVYNNDSNNSASLPDWSPSAGVSVNSTISQNLVFGPLQNNITRFARVLYDKKFVLSYQRPQINRVIRFKPSTLFADSGVGFKGAVYVCVVVYAPNVQHTYRVASKLALTDA